MDESGQTRTDLGLFLDLAATDQTGPLYRRLFVALRQAILSSRIQGNSRLPSTRQLAQTLGVSRNTVKGAYELLQAEGYLDSRRGAGCYVVPLPRLQEDLRQPPPPEGEGGAEPIRPAARSGARGCCSVRFPLWIISRTGSGSGPCSQHSAGAVCLPPIPRAMSGCAAKSPAGWDCRGE